MNSTKKLVIDNLKKNGLEVVGQYQPANDANRYVIIFTSSELKDAVSKIGGLTGFALTLRVGLTKSGSDVVVSYTNPEYWGNAYFREDFSSVSTYYNSLAAKLK